MVRNGKSIYKWMKTGNLHILMFAYSRHPLEAKEIIKLGQNYRIAPPKRI